MTYKAPEAVVVSCESKDDIVRVTLAIEFNDAPKLLSRPPRAPASLVKRENDKDIWAFNLHRAVEKKDDLYIYETYDFKGQLPDVGEQYVFRRWWALDQLAVAQSDPSNWEKRTFVPRNKVEHEHCRICWVHICGQEDGLNFGYSDGNNWVCEECFEKYILSGFGKILGDDIGE
jgi:hypothetical protein